MVELFTPVQLGSFLAGMSLSGVVALVLIMRKTEQLRQALTLEKQQSELLTKQHQELKLSADETRVALQQQVDTLNATYVSVVEDKASLEAKLTAQEAAFKEWKDHLTRDWQEKFELLSLKTLQSVQTQLQETAKKDYQDKQLLMNQHVTELIKPLTEMIKTHEKAVDELGKQTLTETTTLKVELKKTIEQTEKLVQAKNHIVDALTQSKGRGDWGELELIRLLEASGLQKGIHYEFQPVHDDQSRPDIKIMLPNQHIIYIDAKSLVIPLQELQEAEAIVDEAAQGDARKKLTQGLRTEIIKLSKRAYQTKEAGSVDFVVLYVPRESMLRIPLEEDPTLLQDAFKQHVILASPLILMGLLKTVAQGWNQAQISARAKEVQEIGRELHRRAGLFVERFEKLGKTLTTLSNQFDDAKRSFTGQQGFVRQLKKFEQLGCPSDKQLPEGLLDEDEAEVLAQLTDRGNIVDLIPANNATVD